jgi:ABC-2 type transport system ATP-binding protein
MIEVEGLTKSFGNILAVRNISFKVEKGEIVGFLGPNGAGKTTTMRILTGFFPPTSGKARIAGFDVFNDSLEVRRKIGYFLEKAPLYPDMSVKVFLNFVAEVRGIGKREKKQKIGKVMDECGIESVSGRLIGNLSKGYRQRVCLAQALLHDPEVLILDEPTIGLDPEQVVEVRHLIRNLGSERTVLLSTHILPEVSMICQQVIIIDKGEIIAVDTPENLMDKLQESSRIFVQIEGPSLQVLQELKKIPGILQVEEKGVTSHNVFSYLVESKKDMDISKEISSAVFRNNWGLLEMRPMVMTLEDIFLKLVTEEKGV